MGFVSNILAPVIQWVVYLAVGIWILYIIYWIFKKIFKNFGLFWRYKVLRENWDDKKVKWCMDAIEKGWNEIKITKFLLIHNYNQKQIKEMLYYYKNIKKKLMLGGGKEYDRIRPNNEQTKEIPAIK